MRQFVVPQFIDVEDKIIGPVTTRQFVILIVCGLVMFVEYKLSDMGLFIALGIFTFVIFGTVAFLKVNGMPFHYFFLNIFQTLKKPGLRIWSKAKYSLISERVEEKVSEPVRVFARKEMSSSRLSDLSLIVDTGGIYEGEQSIKNYNFTVKPS